MTEETYKALNHIVKMADKSISGKKVKDIYSDLVQMEVVRKWLNEFDWIQK